MAEWTPDPERHRPVGMEMAGRVEGVRPDDDCLDRLARVEDALRQMPQPYVAGAVWWDWLEDVAGPALGYVPTPVKPDEAA